MQEGSYTIQVTVKDSFSASTGESATASYTAQSRVVGTGAVISPTSNPLVALYSAPPSAGSSMYVQFSPLSPNPTWTSTAQLRIVPGESTNFLVAGLLPDTTYLMRHVLDDGTASAPLAFTTGSLPTDLTFPKFTVQQAPAPGTDLTQDMIYHVGVGVPNGTVDTLATDPMGNVNWYYDPVANNFPSFTPSLVPGGTVLLIGGNLEAAWGDTLREVDLAGDTLRETNVDAVNAQLAALGQHSILNFHHDAQRLPNGDTAVLAQTQRTIDVNGTPTKYLGDMVIVLDQNFQVAWVWDAFDWLDTNRLPALGDGPGDWLHSNSIAWSPEDGDLLVSVRNQSWVIKIAYSDGAGDGHVVWRLGQGGDFTINSSDPSPWFSYQHDARYVNGSTIVLFDDGNVRHQTNPHADSRGQELLLDEKTMQATLVVNADLGSFNAALGAAQRLPNGSLAFTPGFQGSPPNNFGQSIEVLPDGTKTYVQKMTGYEYRSYLMSTLYGTPANLLDPGFEDPSQGTGLSAYQYGPTGSAWSFSGDAGLSGNGSGFTSGNPAAPQGGQVAFLQGTGAISQVVDFPAAGSYQLSVGAAQRGNFGTSKEQVQVLVDGKAVGTITPAGTGYTTYTTAAFAVAAGSHTISFVGVAPSGADYTALLDQVSIYNVAPTGFEVSPTGFTDPGFESPSQGAGPPAYQYGPTGSAWSFGGDAGLSGNGSGFTGGNPAAPQGGQVAFLQGTGAISQVVNFPAAAAGSYLIGFSAAQRASFQASQQDFRVLVDGVAVGTFTPSGTGYSSLATAPFAVVAGTHKITFQGLDSAGGDNTAFIDDVRLIQTTAAGLTDAGFESPSVGTGSFGSFLYDPVGLSWTYTGDAGVAGNGSGFTAGNPGAPEGTQVGFLQGTGTISQAVNFAAAGLYRISLGAAQRGNYQASRQDFSVLVDGVAVGTFTPSGTSYQTYTTAAFSVGVGAHTITFRGLDSAGGDNTAFLDQVRIDNVSPGFSDPGFGSPSLGAGPSAYRYDPTGSAWSFGGPAGLSGNGSGFTSGNPAAPQGTQVAFLQGAGGAISQAVDFAAAGSYLISLSAAQRGNFGTSKEEVQVLVDGTVVDTFTPAGTSYTTYTTAAFAVAAGSHTISFVGVDPSGADYTAFLDRASILGVG
jgi:hypothetical protein